MVWGPCLPFDKKGPARAQKVTLKIGSSPSCRRRATRIAPEMWLSAITRVLCLALGVQCCQGSQVLSGSGATSTLLSTTMKVLGPQRFSANMTAPPLRKVEPRTACGHNIEAVDLVGFIVAVDFSQIFSGVCTAEQMYGVLDRAGALACVLHGKFMPPGRFYYTRDDFRSFGMNENSALFALEMATEDMSTLQQETGDAVGLRLVLEPTPNSWHKVSCRRWRSERASEREKNATRRVG